MLRTIVLAWSVVACGWTVCAQGELETQGNIILPDGRRSLVISNHSNKSVTAFAYEYRASILGGTALPEQLRGEFKDSVLYPMEPQVGAGKTVAVAVGLLPAQGQRVINSAPEVRAVVFDDGSAFGDPKWVAQIRDRRLAAIEALDAVISILGTPAKAAGRSLTREALAEDLDRRKTAWLNADLDPERQRVMRGQFDAVTHNLTDAHQSLGALKTSVQTQRDRIAKAAGVMRQARFIPPNASSGTVAAGTPRQ